MSEVVWHDAECGSYHADVDIWRELATAAGGAVLDVGAGTGRVALDLARRGHRVVALDHDAELLDELRRRPGGADVETVVADASSFSLAGRSFPLIIAPMQTVQLLGADGRRGFLAAAREHLAPGGIVAIALTDDFEVFEAEQVLLPPPDVVHVDGVRYVSQPVALRDEGTRFAIERVRETFSAAGSTRADNLIHLDRVDLATIEAEARGAGLVAQPARVIEATADHVGSFVVVLRG